MIDIFIGKDHRWQGVQLAHHQEFQFGLKTIRKLKESIKRKRKNMKTKKGKLKSKENHKKKLKIKKGKQKRKEKYKKR